MTPRPAASPSTGPTASRRSASIKLDRLLIGRDGGLALPAAGSWYWTPERLAAGRYLVELVVEAETQTVVHAVGTIDWVDALPPGMPLAPQATLNAGGQLLATWFPPADADVAGYEISLGKGKP